METPDSPETYTPNPDLDKEVIIELHIEVTAQGPYEKAKFATEFAVLRHLHMALGEDGDPDAQPYRMWDDSGTRLSWNPLHGGKVVSASPPQNLNQPSLNQQNLNHHELNLVVTERIKELRAQDTVRTVSPLFHARNVLGNHTPTTPPNHTSNPDHS